MTSPEAALHSFEDKLKWGEEGEKGVATMLINKGVTVAPLYQFNNHDSAPVCLGHGFALTLPDLTCWNDGVNFFVECKRKNQWVRFNGNIETGLNQKHFDVYEQVKARTGQSVYLFFVHDGEMPGTYYGEIHALKPHMRRWDGMVAGKRIEKPLSLFPKQSLRKLSS